MITEWRSIVTVFVLVLVLGLARRPIAAAADQVPPEAFLAGPGEWLSLGGNFQRTGLSRDRGPWGHDVKWTFETGGAVVGSPTVGFDGRIHVACEDGKLCTRDSNGASLWTLDVNSPLLSAPTIGLDGGLYVGAKDGRLYAVGPNGEPRWTYDTGGAVYSSPAVASNGDIYVGSTDGTLYALSRDGAELWRIKTKGPGVLPQGAVFASPALGADGTVYLAGLYDPNLYALNPGDGSIQWVCRFPPDLDDPNSGGWPFASPVVADDGTIYQTLLYDRHLYAIEPNAGTILWAADLCDPGMLRGKGSTESNGHGWSEPVLGPDGTIYVSMDDPYLRAVDPNGTVKWVTQLGAAGGFTMTFGGGMIYAAGDDGDIHVVSPDGEELSPPLEADGWPALPVVVDDVLLVVDAKDYSPFNEEAGNAVVCFGKEPWPRAE